MIFAKSGDKYLNAAYIFSCANDSSLIFGEFAQKGGDWMGKIKKFLGALSVGAALYSAGCVSAANANSNVEGQQNVQAAADERPHYLRSLPPQEEIDSMTPLERVVESSVQNALTESQGEYGSLPLFLNNAAKLELNVNGQDVEVYFPFYSDNGNSSWTYLPDNTRVDAGLIRQDMQRRLEQGAEIAFRLYGGIAERVNANVERIFPGAAADKEMAIPYTGLTYSDVFGLRDNAERGDFLRDGARIIVAPNYRAWGITALERNMILYTPVAMRVEELNSRPFIIAHELVHNNPMLQGFPGAFAHDLEMQAFVTDIADNTNIFRFLGHGYGYDMRRNAKLYFNVDAKEMLDRLLPVDFLGATYLLDEDVWNEIAPGLIDVMGNLKEHLTETAYPEYHSFEPWWLMANAHFLNAVLPLDVSMAMEHTPQILPAAAYERLITSRRAAMDRTIDEVASRYPFTEQMSFGGISFTYQPSFRRALLSAAERNGFSDDEAEVVYHFAMQRVLLNDSGINYGALKVEHALGAMRGIMGIFDYVMDPDRSMGFRRIAQQEHVQKKYEAYKWMLGRLRTADRYVRFAQRAGNRPEQGFTPLIFDPRADISSMYDVTPLSAGRAVQSNMTAWEFFRANGDEYIIKSYDTTPDLGFSRRDETDFIEVTRKGELKPCIVMFASNGIHGSQALLDADEQGEEGHGLFDRQVSVSSAGDVKGLIRNTLNSPVPEEGR